MKQMTSIQPRFLHASKADHKPDGPTKRPGLVKQGFGKDALGNRTSLGQALMKRQAKIGHVFEPTVSCHRLRRRGLGSKARGYFSFTASILIATTFSPRKKRIKKAETPH